MGNEQEPTHHVCPLDILMLHGLPGGSSRRPPSRNDVGRQCESFGSYQLNSMREH